MTIPQITVNNNTPIPSVLTGRGALWAAVAKAIVALVSALFRSALFRKLAPKTWEDYQIKRMCDVPAAPRRSTAAPLPSPRPALSPEPESTSLRDTISPIFQTAAIVAATVWGGPVVGILVGATWLCS